MRVAIFDKIVRHNIELFKQLIKKQMQKKEKLIKSMKKSYEAFINRNTGEIRYEEIEGKTGPGKEWKMIRINMRLSDHLEEGVFEVTEGDDKQQSFECADLNPAACRALAETVKILNILAYPSAKLKNVERIFHEFSDLEIDSSLEKKEKRDVIHEAWHQVNRKEAEKLLNDCPVGTYLFRKDEFAALMEAELNAEHKDHPIKCITLTYKEWDNKISEKTLVLKEGKWHFFNDDLDLHGTAYPSIESLLKTMDEELRDPLCQD